jgi:anti-sigma-K factor RskA
MTDAAIPPDPIAPDDDDILAAEHALGVTGVAARAVAEVRRASDRVFDDAILAWEARLSPLADQIAPVQPSSRVWPRIEATISPRGRGLNGIGFWRGATAASLALAAASLVVLVMPKAPAPVAPPPAAPAPQPILTSFIQPAKGKTGPVVSATLDRTRGELILTAASINIAADKSAELWVIPAGQAPQSLGVITAGQERRVALPVALKGAGQSTSVLAITAEQLGGSPNGAPMGPVVATGGFMTPA